MGFQQSSMFKGIEDHKPTERDPKLPVGRHTVRIKNCVRFFARSGMPVCIGQVQAIKSDNPEVVIGETYGQGFFYNAKYPYYFFTELKKFVMAATQDQVPEEYITQDKMEDFFVERDGTQESILVGAELCIINENTKKTDPRTGETKERVETTFRVIPEVAA